jgi:tetratricopeptide (TPR) repeat protein
MRPTISFPFLLLFLVVQATPVAAQSAPAGQITSEDLLDVAEPAASPTTPVAPAEGSADPREHTAEQAFMDGDLARALTLYRELAASQAGSPQASRLLVTAAWLQFQLGQAEDARQALTAVLVQDPGYAPRAELYSPDFMALFLNAQRDAAEERQRRAARLLKQGIDALAANDTVAARKQIDACLELAPGSLRAIAALAQVDLAEQRTDAALAGFERVLALERSTPAGLPRQLKAQALNNVGFIYFGRGQFEDAVHVLEEAAHLDTQDPRIWFNLGLARQKLDLAGPGLDALRTAHELDRRDAEISLELGRAYGVRERWMDAVAVLLEATQAHPDSATLWHELAAAQRGLGNLTGMTASLARAIELDPANSQGVAFLSAMELAQSALSARNNGQAIAAAETAARLRPEDGSAWALLGLSQQASGSLAEAAQSLEKAVAVAPDRADIAHNLGTVYLAQKRYPEAEASFRRAVALDPNSTASATALQALERQRDANAKTKKPAKGAPSPAPAKAQSPARPAKPRKPELGAELSAVDYAPLGIRGLLVESVVPGGLADLSGLLVDDLVLRAGGRPLTQPAVLRSMLESTGSVPIQLSVLRAGKPVEIVLRTR